MPGSVITKGRFLRHLAGALLCLASAWLFARAAAFLVLPAPVPFSPVGPSQESAAAPQAARTDISFASVLRRNLMNVALEPPAGLRSKRTGGALSAKEQAELAARLDSLPVSKLGWELLGTVVDTESARACRAIILVEGKQQAYAPGREIRGWKIALVDRRTVVLEKDGRRERLLVGGRGVEAPAQAREASRATALSRQEIMAQLQDLPGLMRQASFAPSTVDGVSGLNVTSIDPGGFFARLGLQANDLLLRANGQPLTSFGDLAGFSRMLGEDSLQLEILRNGRRTVLAFNISG